MTDETTTVCTICGGSLVRGLHAARTTHISIRTCIKALRARAEAAENELADLTERHENEMAKLIALVPSLRQRAEKAETRLAELEAAARWRPVADPPGRDGYYKTACIDLPSETDRVYYSRVGGWDYDIDFWQPLPAGGYGAKEN